MTQKIQIKLADVMNRIRDELRHTGQGPTGLELADWFGCGMTYYINQLKHMHLIVVDDNGRVHVTGEEHE